MTNISKISIFSKIQAVARASAWQPDLSEIKHPKNYVVEHCFLPFRPKIEKNSHKTLKTLIFHKFQAVAKGVAQQPHNLGRRDYIKLIDNHLSFHYWPITGKKDRKDID